MSKVIRSLGQYPSITVRSAGVSDSRPRNVGVLMSNPFWLTDEQMKRLKRFFPKSDCKPCIDDRDGFKT